MNDFKNTSDWTKQGGGDILYTYSLDGKRQEGKLEKEPHVLRLSAERISVLDSVSWTPPDRNQAGSVAAFRSRMRLQIEGRLERCRVHVFTIGEASTVTFDRIEVSIYPTTSDKLQSSSTYNRWSILRADDKPDDGWLATEQGRISYYEENDYFDSPLLSADLWLDNATFNELADRLRTGSTIGSITLEVLADLYQFGWEGFAAGALSTSNFGLLREKEGENSVARTPARLEELGLAWSPNLKKASDTGDFAPVSLLSQSEAEDDTTPLANSDVKHVRARVELLFVTVVLIAAVLAVREIVGWFAS